MRTTSLGLWRRSPAALVGLLLLVPTGCAKKATTRTAASVDMSGDEKPAKTVKPDSDEPAKKTVAFDADTPDVIYFEFDSSKLSDDALTRLADLGDLLLEHPDVSVTIYGHTDERGTDEYNLALGESRARAAERYLSSMGVATHRIKVVSYGEEMPVVDEPGEAAWSKNRRDEFELKH